ncbi:MAG: substrate-binding domain-containing protein [Anaerolineae bacterium]
MATITDVAKRAGVAPVTVSRVINNAPGVNLATRKRVQQAIAELGYVPNVVARSLRSKRTRTLAFIVPDITNAFWTTVARGVEDAAQDHGYSVLLCNTDENIIKQQRYIDLMVSQRVDGVIIAPSDTDANQLATLRRHDIATVVIDRRIEGLEVDTVYSDSVSGAYALTHHLIGLGHTCIAMLSGPEGAATADDRIAGYRLALAEAGIALDPRLVRRGGFSWEAGFELTDQVLDEGLTPTAIFAANNAIALGVIEALSRRGLRIPGDMALVCFDDYPYVTSFFPFLTVVAQSAYEMGANAAQLLLSRLQSPVPLKPRRVVLPVRLMVRYSCGSNPGGRGPYPLNLPLEGLAKERVTLVKPLRAGLAGIKLPGSATGDVELLSAVGGAAAPAPSSSIGTDRLRRALRHEPTDCIPHIELRIAGRNVYEYVLEREVRLEGSAVAPEVQCELAQRLGLDAVACELPDPAPAPTDATLRPPLQLAAPLNHLERYLRAAQGTGVGVFVSFRSVYAAALRAKGYRPHEMLAEGAIASLASYMDGLVAQRERLLRAICDRFGPDLAFVLIYEEITDRHGLVMPVHLFEEFLVPRLQRMIAPALEHDQITVLHTRGKVEDALPALQAIGFCAVHGISPEWNDVAGLYRRWAGKLALMGGISDSLLVKGSAEPITEAVRGLCGQIGLGGGFVPGSAGGITEAVPPRNFVALSLAIQECGRNRR